MLTECVLCSANDVDPVYSLLKCAADLPKTKAEKLKDACSGGHNAAGMSSASAASVTGQTL